MIIDQLNLIKAVNPLDSYEYLIASYFLNEWQTVCSQKMKDVIHLLGVSKSTLNRFCKTLGYKTFAEVQYELYYEMTSYVKYPLVFDAKVDESYQALFEKLLPGKTRVVVLGDSNSISVLLNYEQHFHSVGLDLVMQLRGGDPIEFLKDIRLCEDDFIIYVSLKKSNLELQVDYLGPYMRTVHWLRSHHGDFLYIGKMVNNHEYERFYIEIGQEKGISTSIFKLCSIFEQMYAFKKNQLV